MTYVKNNDKNRESYTFYIESKTNPTDKFHLKNLIFSKLDTEAQYSVTVVSYFLPSGIQNNGKDVQIENIEYLDKETGMPKTSNSSGTSRCDIEIVEVEHWCSEHAHLGATGANQDCTADHKAYSSYVVY